jgi:hypothetical protein
MTRGLFKDAFSIETERNDILRMTIIRYRIFLEQMRVIQPINKACYAIITFNIDVTKSCHCILS